MDEIDVFMDDYVLLLLFQTRNKSYELILEVSKNTKRQMVLLTPKEIEY